MDVITTADWVVVSTTAVVVALAVVFHFEVITWLKNWVEGRDPKALVNHPHRATLLFVMFVLLIAHIGEIWLFGVAYWLLIEFGEHGRVVGYDSYTFLDYVYFSATTYTTVGWGDLSSIGEVRFLAGTQSLVGFMLITWSASFIYLMMARTWGLKDESRL